MKRFGRAQKPGGIEVTEKGRAALGLPPKPLPPQPPPGAEPAALLCHVCGTVIGVASAPTRDELRKKARESGDPLLMSVAPMLPMEIATVVVQLLSVTCNTCNVRALRERLQSDPRQLDIPGVTGGGDDGDKKAG